MQDVSYPTLESAFADAEKELKASLAIGWILYGS